MRAETKECENVCAQYLMENCSMWKRDFKANIYLCFNNRITERSRCYSRALSRDARRSQKRVQVQPVVYRADVTYPIGIYDGYTTRMQRKTFFCRRRRM